ncbi:MAG: peptide ABC transporter substrate-binding protein [Chloroflexi bacterium]|nr:peptide ABC transporter substrate-binding protein [Chloroflexota bacterium]
MSRHKWILVSVLVVLFGCIFCVCAAVGLYLLIGREFEFSWTAEQGTLPTAEDTLRLAGGIPPTLDPALVWDVVAAEYVVEIFSGLVTLDAQLEIVPDLAERWDLSEDGRTYTFHLRQGLRFHDGRPLTADDVKFSLERACSPETGDPQLIRTYLADIVGALDLLSGRADSLIGVEVIDERTVRVTLITPRVDFLAKLTYPIAFVVDRHNVKDADWTRHPNGSGPFKLVEYTDDRIVLERNEHYCQEVPALRRVVFLLDAPSPLTMYENGELDMAEVTGPAVERALDPSNPLYDELHIVPRLDIQYLAMNVTVPPFDSVKVRQAFVHALDRERLARVVMNNTVVPAIGILPPGMPGYNPHLAGLEFDPEHARRLIRESGYGNATALPEVTLTIGGESGVLPSYVEAILAMYEENLGITISVEQSDRASRRGKTVQFFTSGWLADYPDPSNFLEVMFHSESGLNETGYFNPEVDQLLEAARVERDHDKRIALFQQAEAIIVREAPWVPLWHERTYLVVKPYVKGVAYTPAIIPWLKDVYIQN